MKDWKRHIGIWILLTVPIFDASSQYKLLTRGQVNPYDSAVAIRIDQYRKETLKFKLADTLVDSLNAEIAMLNVAIIRRDSSMATAIQQINRQGVTISRQQIVIADLNFNLQRVLNYQEQGRGKTILGKLFRKPEFWFGAGLLSGILIAK